ncbi:MAG: alpha/beta hydrolase family protein [Litorimonas sp.]
MVDNIRSDITTERDPVRIDAAHPPALAEVNFESFGDRLNGLLHQANGIGPHPTVVLLHGYPGNEKNLGLAQSMRRTGYNVLFFHYRRAWGSGRNFSFSHVVEDVGSATDFLRENADEYRAVRTVS